MNRSTKRSAPRWLGIAAVTMTALTSSACLVTTEGPRPRRREIEPPLPAVTQGTLVLRWTIDDKTDPNECIKSASSELEVSVVDASSGREVGAWRQNCSVFSLSVKLDPGTYTGSAVLLDAAGHPRTTSVTIDSFSLRGNDTLDVPVDFPNDSFL